MANQGWGPEQSPDCGNVHSRSGEPANAIHKFGLAACLAAGLSSTCLGQDLKGNPRFGDTQVGFEPSRDLSATLPCPCPAPTDSRRAPLRRREVPTIDLRRFGGFDDGMYNYQLTASTDEKVPVRTSLDNGRDGAHGLRSESRVRKRRFPRRPRHHRQKFDPVGARRNQAPEPGEIAMHDMSARARSSPSFSAPHS